MELNRKYLIDFMQSMIPANSQYLKQSGGSYLVEIRELESILRPLWGILPAYINQPLQMKQFDAIKRLRKCVEGKRLPTISTANRQIAVEVGVLGYGIGQFGKDFLGLFSAEGQSYLIDWLNKLNHIEFPAGNWYFFLILMNGALKERGLPYSERHLSFAKERIESFYLGDGWYSDGLNEQRDYYIAFAFHFYGLLYARFSSDPQGEKYLNRAALFAEDFYYWFDSNGRSIPFGRSLTYRFAHISFWSALIITKAYQKTTLGLAAIKGIITRNLQFWGKQPIIVPNANNLSIGYGYSNLLLSEDYNAPGSPMWAFKAFVLLELSADHSFWKLSEERYQTKELIIQPHAGFHITQTNDQTIALSNLQSCRNEKLYHQKEKYTKFAYSSYFGFNLTRENQGIEAFAIDSSLAFSLIGHDQFQTRQQSIKSKSYPEYSCSYWTVWNEVTVISYLIPVDGNTHLRIHEVDTPCKVITFEGGFPLFDWNSKFNAPRLNHNTSRIENRFGYSMITELSDFRTVDIVTQGPNTNIYSAEKNAIPVLKVNLSPGKHTLATLVSGGPQLADIPEFNFKVTENTYELESNYKKITVIKERFN